MEHNLNKYHSLKSKVLRIFLLFSVLSVSVLFNNCRKVHFYEGRSVIINRTFDQSLNDSALIFGNVFSAVDNTTPEINARIWCDKIPQETLSDFEGYYQLKLPVGTYDINCLGKHSNSNEVEILKELVLTANEKVMINFYQEITVE